jgi:hypothetical protein
VQSVPITINVCEFEPLFIVRCPQYNIMQLPCDHDPYEMYEFTCNIGYTCITNIANFVFSSQLQPFNLFSLYLQSYQNSFSGLIILLKVPLNSITQTKPNLHCRTVKRCIFQTKGLLTDLPQGVYCIDNDKIGNKPLLGQFY